MEVGNVAPDPGNVKTGGSPLITIQASLIPQGRGPPLHLIRLSGLYLDGALEGAVDRASVGNGHESFPLFPAQWTEQPDFPFNVAYSSPLTHTPGSPLHEFFGGAI